ncbi:MAG: 3-hydroxyacyl-CoA dehydrogenase, partial [Magnetovibrio sp.]|nr:3-hydroxyacyl-CoA dehydrogenase [Magnetovibrio sp.]
MSKDYSPPDPIEMSLPGPSGAAALNLAIRNFANQGVATPHDVTIAKELAVVLSGGNTDVVDVVQETDILKLERQAILRLAKTRKTRARISHMLKTGKPLRN